MSPYFHQCMTKLIHALIKTSNTHNSSIRSDEGLTLETSAFQIFRGGSSTFINSFDKTQFLFNSTFEHKCGLGRAGERFHGKWCTYIFLRKYLLTEIRRTFDLLWREASFIDLLATWLGSLCSRRRLYRIFPANNKLSEKLVAAFDCNREVHAGLSHSLAVIPLKTSNKL